MDRGRIKHFRWYWYDGGGNAVNTPPKRPNRFNAPYSPEEMARYYPKYAGRVNIRRTILRCQNDCCVGRWD